MSDPNEDDTLKQEIAQRAYLRFCDRGCAHGGDVDDWLEAEREVRESQKNEAMPDTRPAAKSSRSRQAKS
jgi:hypothetical protein